MAEITVKYNMGEWYHDNNAKRFLSILQASSFIVEREYKLETPVNLGDMRSGVRTTPGTTGYRTTTDATSRGFPYPVALYEGIGSLAGAGDYGFTTGRVRSGDIAWGIGGIRPNKVADRAADKAEPQIVNFMEDKFMKYFGR